ncbi:MAG: GGDEF domain-containing protein, partial [Oxalobacteraceae bacterium]
AQAACLGDLAGLILNSWEAEQRHANLAHASSHALRTEHMLRLVSEAGSCANALTSLLGELCLFHGAAVGRIWQVTSPGELFVEISRFNDKLLDEHSYYRLPPLEPVTASNSMTAEAIRRNVPHAVWYSQVQQPGRYALLSNAIASGLASQVSFPIWVKDHRFGIALAFSTERLDLADVVADLASMASTIQPQLFRKVAEERILFVAHHDDLTQLANRVMFQERLNQATEAETRGEHGVALLYLDLDGFKQVNDLHGHEVGDKLLAAVAARLRDNVRERDTVARIGGDEFAVIQPEGSQPNAAMILAARLVDAIAQPFEIDGVQSSVGVSIGIAVHPWHGETSDQLLRNADTALYSVKKAGRNAFRVFELSMSTRRQERLQGTQISTAKDIEQACA